MSPNKRFTKPSITQPLKNCDFLQFLAITQVWDVIETWGFCVDDPCDFLDIPISPQKNYQTSHAKYFNGHKSIIFKAGVQIFFQVKKLKPFLSEL